MKINWDYWVEFPGKLLAIPVVFLVGLLWGIPINPPLYRIWVPRREDIDYNLRTFGRAYGYPLD